MQSAAASCHGRLEHQRNMIVSSSDDCIAITLYKAHDAAALASSTVTFPFAD